MHDVTHDNVRALFYHGRAERKWSTNTFVVFHKSLRVFFRWCVEQHYLPSNPLDDIEKPKIEQKLPIRLTKQDALRLLEIVYNHPYHSRFIRARNHAIFATFIHAGLRRSELVHLNYSDVDLENMSIFVKQGKGGKDRLIPISLVLAESLERYIAERRKKNKTCPEFFASARQNAGFTLEGLKHLVEEVCKVGNLKFSVHKLRHTFATLMIEGGCDIYSLSKMMGHSDIKTTTIYLSASIEHLRSQIMKHPLNN